MSKVALKIQRRKITNPHQSKSTHIDIEEFKPLRKYYKYQEFDEDIYILTRLQEATFILQNWHMLSVV